ncbi:endonuclease-reverse transcriptase [Plakobranchus ocellatus]|uniref:Endonuclease-reverse transcriptase n=1 Tax=Plakobranchus ocellatus TaxID=259542 RepID=A0AAV3Z1G4_9GAST|nr:endonuclease-reverse transcriptase [Plakobranchus ocellatus]
MGDFNAKVGTDKVDDIVGKHGLGIRNEREECSAKKTNESVLNEANRRRSPVRTIRKRQATFLGHVMRRRKHLVTTGKFEGKRSRGRQREKIMDGLATWLGTGKVLDTLAAVKDRICGGT